MDIDSLNNRIGINNTAPLVALDVRGSSGTLAVASISAKTSFAALVADNDGVGDLFTASASGWTRFEITNAGNVLPGSNLTQNLGSSTLQWANIYAGNLYQNGVSMSQYWQRNSGTVEPLNITDDLLIGATSSTSADFRVTGNSYSAGTTSIASISAKTSFAALVIDNSGVGDIIVASSSATPGAVNQGGQMARTQFEVSNVGGVYGKTFYDLNNPAYYLDPAGGTSLLTSGSVGIGMTTTPTAPLDIGGTGDASMSGNLAFNGLGTNYIYMLNNSSLQFSESVAGTGTTTNVMTLTNGGNVGIGLAGPVSTLTVNGGISVGTSGPNALITNQNQPEIYYSAATGTTYPFLTAGNLVLQGRSTASRDIVFVGGATPAVNMVIQGSTGNVGIGTATPALDLDVNGQSLLEQGSLAGYTFNTSAGNYQNWWFPVATVSATAQFQYATADILMAKRQEASSISDQSTLIHLAFKMQAAINGTNTPVFSLNAAIFMAFLLLILPLLLPLSLPR